MATVQTGYSQDFAAWAKHQAALLKAGRWQEADIENLVEEIECMGKSEHRELKSRMLVLVMHLLKWHKQPTLQSNSWRRTIVEQRAQIPYILKDSPSLKANLNAAEWLQDVWNTAVTAASKETGIPKTAFPENPIWTAAQILDDDFYPEP
ncbi:DUF29 domain-containing protein [Stenoxybacter acetivorans]|uniref:DUF29 domain-containing protein n=1 Tax=Stenoxybacter acetivorans TaxID=422441 RepID=UPI00056512AC|nr:DUF29 domain-containing protein [Stenoxybacter acetivorans]